MALPINWRQMEIDMELYRLLEPDGFRMDANDADCLVLAEYAANLLRQEYEQIASIPAIVTGMRIRKAQRDRIHSTQEERLAWAMEQSATAGTAEINKLLSEREAGFYAAWNRQIPNVPAPEWTGTSVERVAELSKLLTRDQN